MMVRYTACSRIYTHLLILLTLVGLGMWARPALAQTTEPRVLVRFAADVTPETRDALIASLGGELVTWMPQIQVAEVRLGVQYEMVSASAAALMAADPAVVYVEVDGEVAAAGDFTYNDPDFADATLWYGLRQVEAPAVWETTQGAANTIIAVVDSGIRLEHPEFDGRLVTGYDFVNEDAQPDDDFGHGTHVAGTIAAGLNNGQGIAGVCPRCRLMPIKVLNALGCGSYVDLTQGILYAVDHGAKVINISLGSSLTSQTVLEAVNYALARGVVIVAAAGNFGNDRPFYPAAYEGVISVGATDRSGVRWIRSNYGPTVDFMAPGEMIYSAYHDLDNLYQGYTYLSGTSMAAPYVSGLVGLLRSAAPTLTQGEVYEALRLGAREVRAQDAAELLGNGLVNAVGAFAAPVPTLAEALRQLSHDDDGILEPAVSHVIYLPELASND